MCLAVPGLLATRFEQDGLAMGRVAFAGIERDICLAYVPEAAVGQYVLVHVGFAIRVVDETEALRTLALLDELVEFDDGEAPPVTVSDLPEETSK